jgi:hypothetical protein
MALYGVTYSLVEPHVRGLGSLSAYAADVLTYAKDAGQYVDTALSRSGYDPAEVSARASTDELYDLCSRIVALRSAAALVTSQMMQDTTIASALIARSEELLARIVNLPAAVDRDGYDPDLNSGGVRYALKANVSSRSWSTGGKT